MRPCQARGKKKRKRKSCPSHSSCVQSESPRVPPLSLPCSLNGTRQRSVALAHAGVTDELPDGVTPHLISLPRLWERWRLSAALRIANTAVGFGAGGGERLRGAAEGLRGTSPPPPLPPISQKRKQYLWSQQADGVMGTPLEMTSRVK